jgi:hypothetical protein
MTNEQIQKRVISERDTEMLNEMIQLLRSAAAIADRRGQDVAWERFAASIRKLGIGWITARTYRVLPSDNEFLDLVEFATKAHDKDEIVVMPDGDRFVAYIRGTFINLQESNAAFGETPYHAITNFVKEFPEEIETLKALGRL